MKNECGYKTEEEFEKGQEQFVLASVRERSHLFVQVFQVMDVGFNIKNEKQESTNADCSFQKAKPTNR